MDAKKIALSALLIILAGTMVVATVATTINNASSKTSIETNLDGGSSALQTVLDYLQLFGDPIGGGWP